MAMDIVDENLARAERDASPDQYQRRGSDEIERVLTTSTASSSSSAVRPAGLRSRGMSRISTQNDLERHPTELSRIHTARSQHTQTVGGGATGGGLLRLGTSRASKPLPNFGAGKPFPPPLPEMEEYVVEFDGPEDPLHPQNWPMRRKILTTAMLSFTTLTSTFTSSIFSTATRIVAQEFGVGAEVGLLGTTCYVLGFAFGPILWAPLSELRGRKLPLCVGMFGFSVFTIAVAVSKDIQTVIICRFFSGLFGSCPLAVVAAVLSDIFNNSVRGIALAIFSMTVFTGPLMAPFIGGFIVESYLGWRWTMYIPSFMGFFAFALDLLFLEETYPPIVLIDKAAELRRRTKNWGIHAKQEEIEVDFRELITKNFTRPLRLLFTEPIILLLTIYMSFIYGLLYLFLTAYSLVFEGVYGFNAGQSGLTFWGMIAGQLLAGASIVLQQPWYNRKLAANNGIPVPEWRLPNIMAGGIAFAIGLFWFGWTGYTTSVPWYVPALSGLCSGFGLLSIFLQSLNYLVDAYLMFAASAVAGNTFLRSLCGAVFPLFATQMFNGMGIQWASTLLGCVATALVPIPFVFYFYGAKIRQKSSYAPTFAPGGKPQAPAQDDDSGSTAVEKEEEQAGNEAAMGSVPSRASNAGGPKEPV